MNILKRDLDFLPKEKAKFHPNRYRYISNGDECVTILHATFNPEKPSDAIYFDSSGNAYKRLKDSKPLKWSHIKAARGRLIQ